MDKINFYILNFTAFPFSLLLTGSCFNFREEKRMLVVPLEVQTIESISRSVYVCVRAEADIALVPNTQYTFWTDLRKQKTCHEKSQTSHSISELYIKIHFIDQIN